MKRGLRSWVTYASNDKEGLSALILAKSLKWTITTKLLTVFVSSNGVSEEMRELLEDAFDRCITIDKKRRNGAIKSGMPYDILARVHCYKLKKLKKFVFLDCNCLVLKNSDELFKQIGIGEIIDENQKDANLISLIADTHSAVKFRTLMDSASLDWSQCLQTDKRTSVLATIRNFYSHENPIMEKYSLSVEVLNPRLTRNWKDMSIVCFNGKSPVDMLESLNEIQRIKNGTLEKEIFNVWAQLLVSINQKQNIPDSVQHHPTVMQTLESTIVASPITTSSINFNLIEDLKDSVAIVGMSLRFPGANTLDDFWELLINGKDGIIKTPENRWNSEQCFMRPESTRNTQAGFLTCPIDQIDGKFFGLSPVEVSYLDPQQRLTLQVMWEALEHAAINPGTLKNSNTGVFGGWWRTDYKEMMEQSGLQEQEFFRTYMGNSLGTTTARISHVLELTGPSISTESGCSTSIVAVDMACKSLINEDCDLSLAFGVNLLIHPFCTETMNFVVAPDCHCKTFDANADGFGRAEGCAVLILKRFSDAVRDGDRIHALIRGSAVVQEGPSRSMGTPTKNCEALAMELALEDAGVEPKDVSFVETHGTGTPVGDPLEVAAVTKVYSKGREEVLTIGSVKTNIGHTESCSGIAGIIKTVLSLQNEFIPPHRNFEKLNPEINLDVIPAQIPLKPIKWEKSEGKPRIAGVSSFGITGTDAHVIIQETPEFPKQRFILLNAQPSINILKLSAKSKDALEGLISSYKTFLSETDLDLKDISYTANIGRGDFQFRTAIAGTDKMDFIQKLEKSVQIQKATEEIPKICFLFTGQGSQFPGMSKSLYENNPIFRMHFDDCNSVLNEDYKISIKDAMWGDNEQTENLSRTLYSQTSIFCVEFCLLKLWESWGVKPDYVLGHSLGEFAAAVAAGVLNFEDALKLVAERSRLIDSLPQGKMLVIKEDKEKVDILLKQAFNSSDKWLDYAAINSSEQTVLAGTSENIASFASFCQNNLIKTHVLQAAHAFHSRLMNPMLDEYKKVTQTVKYNKAKCTYVSGMDGKILGEKEIDAEYWVRHTREPVRFTHASKVILEANTSQPIFLEVGPQPVLSTLMMVNADNIPSVTNAVSCMPSLRKNEDSWTTMFNTLGQLYKNGVEVEWENVQQYSGAQKVTVPFYKFQNKSGWIESNIHLQRPIHPLVGKSIPNPSQLKLFQNELYLNQVPFLKDHVIGKTVVYPGAGFLEMCLMSGHCAYQCIDGSYTNLSPSAQFTLENFTIWGPLAVSENEATFMQIHVSSEDSEQTRVSIYSKLSLDKDTHKWIQHATANFHPYVMQWEGDESKDTLEAVKSRCLTPDDTDFYKKFFDLGLKFGPKFQTLKTPMKGENETVFEAFVEDISDAYICHPIIIDAMFQAIIIDSDPDTQKLRVPVSVEKFIWYSKLDTTKFYIHCIKMKDTKAYYMAVLYNEYGKQIAIMIGFNFIQTTVNTIISAIESQKTSLPNMYEDIWKEQLGPLAKRISEIPLIEEPFTKDFKNKIESNVNSEIQVQYTKSNRLYLLYMIRAVFVDLRWSPRVGQTFSLTEVSNSLSILPKFLGTLRYIFKEFAHELIVQILEENKNTIKFKVKRCKLFKDQESLNNDIEFLYKELSKNREILSFCKTAQKLADILLGKQSALHILYPEDRDQVAVAEILYTEGILTKEVGKIFDNIFPVILKKFENKKVTPVIRILEAGAGTGSLTKWLLPHLDAQHCGVEYTYTDISQAFMTKGESIFKGSRVHPIYKVLNIEMNPMSQRFIPNYYDVICAKDVIHATDDVRKAVRNLRNLLRPGGILLLSELTKPFRAINLSFGLLDGFWKFTDHDLRPYNCEMSTEKWEGVLKENQFDQVASYSAYFGHAGVLFAQASRSTEILVPYQMTETAKKAWIVFSDETLTTEFFCKKLLNIGKRVVVIKKGELQPNDASEIQSVFNSMSTASKELEGVIYLWGLDQSNEDYATVCQPFLNVCKILANLAHNVKLMAYTRGIWSIGDHELSLPTASPLIGMSKVLHNENPNVLTRWIDLDPSVPCSTSVDEAWTEIFLDDSEPNVAYRKNYRHVCRLSHLRVTKTGLSIPKSGRYRLVLPSSKAISDLRFVPVEKSSLGAKDIEIQVKAYSLNFRDMFAVLKPDSQFDKLNTVGIDYAGEVVAVGPQVKVRKVGDRVFGINLNGDAFPSHMKAAEDMVVPLHENMTFAEASTLPAASVTAYMCLIKVAKLQENETVLIHTASGGVGIAAIQIAQSLNCNIIATAGSHRKRIYLKNLGIKHVFHSRNTDYEKKIREIVGGKGVDVVLNSLTGLGFKEASLAICNKGARFIEMSKLNTWTKEDVKSLRADVFYEIVDLSVAPDSVIKEYLTTIQDFVKEPIPYVRFDATEIRNALNYMQKAKHIGKIVCVMPQSSSDSSDLKCPMFNDRSSYIITGGLGGIGIEVAKWMTYSGAKHIVLVGRSQPNAVAAEEINKLKAKGVNVIVRHTDIGNYESCAQLIESFENNTQSPLRGIMHAAGVLSDASFKNQTWEKFETVFNAKVKGGWNLHKATLNHPLEFFCMFSSATANCGSSAQSNYVAANTYLDSLTHYRNSLGLPASTVNWGQWGQVGVAAAIDIVGLKPITPFQGISALEYVMKAQRVQTCVLEINLNLLRKTLPITRKYLEDIKDDKTNSVDEIQINNEGFWREFEAVGNELQSQYEVVSKYIRIIIRQLLKLDENEEIDENADLQDIGMDSLVMIEMKNVLQSLVGDRAKITANAVKDYNTVNKLGNRIVALISGIQENAIPTRVELNQLILEDSELPADIKPPAGEPCKPSEIRTILITGVSGNLGPYMLREISKRKNIQKVYCLMRSSKKSFPKERLLKILNEKKLSSEIRLEMLECVTGNVSQENLGMSKEVYENLSAEVDAVFHLAVKAVLLDVYKKSDSSTEDVRNVNVIGTKNVLKFACMEKSKIIYHASTTIAIPFLGEDGRLSEDWPQPGDFDKLPNSAYAISKYVCEILMAEAVGRGLSCKVFRFPFIGGDSKLGGNISFENNHLLLRMMSYMQIKIMPALCFPFMIIPVDLCAEISARIFFNDETGCEVYNVSNPNVNDEQELEDFSMEFGFEVEAVEPDLFFEKLEAEKSNEVLHFMKSSLNNDIWNMVQHSLPEPIVAWIAGTENVFLSKKLEKLIPEYPDCMEASIDILKRDLQFGKQAGIFNKLGLDNL